MNLVLVPLLLGLSILSGMLGIGVAFAAVPFLSLYLPDLVSQVQPLSLLLNGVTAMFSLAGFAQAGYVDWRRGGILALATTLSAPIGSYLAHLVSPVFIWTVYFVSVLYLCWRLMRPHIQQQGKERFRSGVLLAIPISIITGFLGVGPGFLLMPALMLVGFNTRSAAGMNALAVTPSSFSAVLPHWSNMHLDFWMAVPLIFSGALGSFIGARLATRQIPEAYLRKILLAVILVATVYRLARLFI
ncbi:MAG: hypothetical protein A3F74_06920 [Betaproteobacteria bacterium RIFCSPLOWO2_12_FULL_62_58]|nr:MAG: hypothetical protein A3F74_06920 [Betaproteobacteria bacterium RIFCSPLOWO2_12_FULL_62_58]